MPALSTALLKVLTHADHPQLLAATLLKALLSRRITGNM